MQLPGQEPQLGVQNRNPSCSQKRTNLIPPSSQGYGAGLNQG